MPILPSAVLVTVRKDQRKQFTLGRIDYHLSCESVTFAGYPARRCLRRGASFTISFYPQDDTLVLISGPLAPDPEGGVYHVIDSSFAWVA